MTAKYYALLTHQGAAKLANASALGIPLQITHMGVGDGGGTLPTPDPAQTGLVAERRRALLNSLTIDEINSSQIIAEQVIPENEGGFWIREIGLFDSDETLIAVANCPESYKPQLQEGSGRTQTVRMILIISSTEAVTLKIDPSVVLATRKYVDERDILVQQYADEALKLHIENANPHIQYAYKNSPKLTGIPMAPTATAGTDTEQLATTAFVKRTLSALIDGSPDALNTLNELAAALGDDPHFATTVLDRLSGKMAKELNGADIENPEQFIHNLGLGSVATRDAGTKPDNIPDMSHFLGTNSENGYQKLPSGLILQWAVGASDKEGNMALSFPISFKNRLLGGIANEANPMGWAMNSLTVWAFNLPASTLSIAKARVRGVGADGVPSYGPGISGRILAWGY